MGTQGSDVLKQFYRRGRSSVASALDPRFYLAPNPARRTGLTGRESMGRDLNCAIADRTLAAVSTSLQHASNRTYP